VLEHLNRLPRQQHGTDIMRVRDWALSGRARAYRQTVITSSLAAPELAAAFGRLCGSHAGRARLLPEPPGVLSRVVPQVRQSFERFAAPSAPAAADARFDHFCAAVWPRLQGAAGAGLLLFVPHYYDYVRLRLVWVEERRRTGVVFHTKKTGVCVGAACVLLFLLVLASRPPSSKHPLTTPKTRHNKNKKQQQLETS
jgi:hypothetical protein